MAETSKRQQELLAKEMISIRINDENFPHIYLLFIYAYYFNHN